MRRALALALLPALLVAAPVEAKPRGEVTPAEFARVKVGMTRERVEQLFGAGRGCKFDAYSDDYGRHVRVQYREKPRPAFLGIYYTVINYTVVDGEPTVVKLPGDRFKEQHTNLAC